VVGNGSSFLTARLDISGYSSVKLSQNLGREILGNFCFKTESLAIYRVYLNSIDKLLGLKMYSEKLIRVVCVAAERYSLGEG
jgi:hypothetical protein